MFRLKNSDTSFKCLIRSSTLLSGMSGSTSRAIFVFICVRAAWSMATSLLNAIEVAILHHFLHSLDSVLSGAWDAFDVGRDPESFGSDVLEDEHSGWNRDRFHGHASVGDESTVLAQFSHHVGAVIASNTVESQFDWLAVGPFSNGLAKLFRSVFLLGYDLGCSQAGELIDQLLEVVSVSDDGDGVEAELLSDLDRRAANLRVASVLNEPVTRFELFEQRQHLICA
ncbi:hypothetical protein OGATHE_005705 [Ogataea polymorpha]|uniref:Uncharacterized protein n=1 Tax=Ogataea polymorpha TaxID=460523 RepID=A0A9P8SZB3_9ASCO|nr:hypothetical protein OGATHE_005705 [Ogataea polymorpha]